jgi:thymidine kinase
MAKLFFSYSVMNAGKSTQLLNVAYTYRDHGGRVLLFTSAKDDRSGLGKIKARGGNEADAHALRPEENVFEIVREAHDEEDVAAVLVDEVQFLTPQQITQMSDIADFLDIPVMTYGLKNNIFGELFSPAISTLLALANEFNEVKQICHCGSKATMILKYNPDGSVVREGEVVETGGESRYISVCRPHWKDGDIGPRARKAVFEAGFGPRVSCRTCGNEFPTLFGDIEQAYGCAAKLSAVGTVSGYYGSTVADMTELKFDGPVPESAKRGVICDDCLRRYIADGSLKKVVYDVLDDEQEDDPDTDGE